ADELARDFGLEVVADYGEMLAREDIDAVLIATPNWLHAEMTREALAAGKHVFCQKPMALTIDEADRVVEAAKASAGVLQFGFMLRFTPPFPEIKRMIESGAIGEVIATRAAVFGWEPSADWFYDKAMGGGVILDTMIRFADLVWAYSYNAEQQYFVDQIRGSADGAGAANVDEARAALAVSLAAQQSLDERKAVTVA